MNWHFYSAAMSPARPRWMWICEDDDHNVTLHCERSYTSYAACLSDALKHGYATRAAALDLER